MHSVSPSEKNTLRAEIRQRLKSLGSMHRAESSWRINKHILEFPFWSQAQTLCLFASLASEPDTTELFKHAWSLGKRVVLPRVQDLDSLLSLHRVTSLDELQKSPLGFQEPAASAEIAPLSEIDLILVPGIAFDRHGGRMGRGGGYYDRLLSEPDCRAVLLGSFFSAQEVPRVPREAWDQTLQWIVTEEECFRMEPEILQDSNCRGRASLPIRPREATRFPYNH